MGNLRSRFVTALCAASLVLVVPLAGVAAAGTTERVSVDSSEVQADNESRDPAISADGRFVAFWSYASNLVAGDTNGSGDIFVRDRLTGTTSIVSVASDGTQENDSAGLPSINADGRYVAFESAADNLVAGDTNGATDIFVHDRLSGQTTRVSVDSAGGQVPGASQDAHISGDGRYVAFWSFSANLVAGDTNGGADAFVHDRLSGTTELVTVNSAEVQSNGNSNTERPQVIINGDGRYVVFVSNGTNIDPRASSVSVIHVFIRDRLLGTTEVVDLNTAGTIADTSSVTPSISADGRYVAFAGASTNLAPDDTEFDYDVFVRDRQLGTTERVSVDSAGNGGNGQSQHPAISADGEAVSFFSSATNLVTGDTNGLLDVFVHDRSTGITERVSGGVGASEANGQSTYPDISGDGRFVTFPSDASNLVTGDTNGVPDAFVTDRQAVVFDGTPSSVTLTPPDAVNDVGTSHTVTATVRNASASPLPNVVVRFSVSGSSSVTGSCTTDATGKCSFTYVGPLLPGADVITAYADSNGNATQDSTEPFAEATKAWTLPTSTAGQTTGGGQILNGAGNDKIAFGYNAKSFSDGPKGNCSVVDPSPTTNVKIKCLDVTSLVQSGTHATFFGNATVNGVPTTYRIDVDDLSEAGAGHDTFRIVTASGYTAGGTLTNGNIQVHN
jgi:hypothetical protein